MLEFNWSIGCFFSIFGECRGSWIHGAMDVRHDPTILPRTRKRRKRRMIVTMTLGASINWYIYILELKPLWKHKMFKSQSQTENFWHFFGIRFSWFLVGSIKFGKFSFKFKALALVESVSTAVFVSHSPIAWCKWKKGASWECSQFSLFYTGKTAEHHLWPHSQPQLSFANQKKTVQVMFAERALVVSGGGCPGWVPKSWLGGGNSAIVTLFGMVKTWPFQRLLVTSN